MIIQFIQAGGDPEVEEKLSALTDDFVSVLDRSVQDLAIPEGTTTIGENAFASCTVLSEVTIPSSVTNIEAGAFGENRSLETINFEGTTPPTVEEGAFSQLPSGVTVTVPEGSEDVYSAVTDNIENSTAFIILFTDYSGNTTEMYSKYSAITYDDASNPLPQCPSDGWARIETKGLKGLRDNALLFEPADEYIFDEKLNYSECTPLRGNAVDGTRSVPQKVTFKCPTLSQYFDGRIAEACSGLSSITFYCAEAPLLNTEATHITTADTAPVGELIVPEGAHNYGIYRERICGEDWTIKNLSGQTMGTITITDGDGIVQDYSYETFPSSAYSRDSTIVSVVVGRDVQSVSPYIFRYCMFLTGITIESGVTSIGNSAFYGCERCTSLTLPDTITSIGNSAFFNCRYLPTITIPNSVTSIGDSAFSGGWRLSSVTINANCAIGNYAFANCSGLTSLAMSEGVTSIGGNAFNGCSGLTSVTIPNSVTSIGTSAFENCSGLTSIDIGSGVTVLSGGTFHQCVSLSSIICRAENAPILKGINHFLNVASSGTLYVPDGADYSTWLAKLPSGWTTDVIPLPPHNLEIETSDGEIEDYNIEGTLPAGMFSGRTDITGVYITDGGITEIGEGAFSGCTNLSNIEANGSPDLVSIDNNAFRGCSMMGNILLPVNLASIGSNAFAGCSNLSYIECFAEFAPMILSDTFDGVAEEGELHLYDSSVSGYDSWTGALPSGWTVVYDNDFGD